MPLFLTKAEVHELYLFQCSMTAYDPKKEQINSILDIPLVSYADSFKTHLVPVMEPFQLNRLFNLTTTSKTNVDRILCNQRHSSIRFLNLESLEYCQRHSRTNLFVCKGREISMKYTDIMDCNNIKELPKTLVIQTDKNEFFIENRFETLSIFCNGTLSRKIEAHNGPIKVIIPSHCSIKSPSLTITNGTDIIDISIEQREEPTQVIIFEENKWEQFKSNVDNVQFETNSNDSKLFDEIDRMEQKTDRDLAVAKKQQITLENKTLSILTIFATVASVLGILLAAIFYLTKKCDNKHIPNDTLNIDLNPKIVNFESRQGMVELKVMELENSICSLQKLFDNDINLKTKNKAAFHKLENLLQNSGFPETDPKYIQITEVLSDFQW